MNSKAFFSDTYIEARSRFLEAATEAGARTESYKNPHARGPGDIRLYTDTAWIGPADAKAVLLNTCGSHGAEGYAGSAAQLAWLKTGGPSRLQTGGPSRLRGDVAMLMVHGVNPFGFSWGLRGTENNVDLNRNFLDHLQPHPENALYEEMHHFLCPASMDDTSVQSCLAESSKLSQRFSQWELEDALSRGQYTHPDGYHFGGTHPEWSNLTIRRIIRRELNGVARIGFIDWHSGPTGNGELIHLCFSDPAGPEFARASHWWGRHALDPRTVNAMWGSKRPTRRGIMFWGIEQELGSQARMTGAVVEFRSSQHSNAPARSMRVPMLERWLRFVGGFDAPEAARYFEEIREDYAPRRRSFQDNMISNGLGCYDAALRGLAEWQWEDAKAAD
jgi:hypothetical protein